MEHGSLALSGELFSGLPDFLPVLTPGETLFSFAAEYHRLSGNVLAKKTSIQLFGDARAGLRHDFPSDLDYFVEITRGKVGDADTLAFERTLLGFFAPFQDESGVNRILALMRGGSIEKVKSALGLLPSRLGGFFPLKACQDCVIEDKKNYLVSKWHLEHQWPSIWICRKHRKLLQVLKREFQSKDLRRWLLPEDVAEQEWEQLPHCSSLVKSKLIWLAELSEHFVLRRGEYYVQQLLRYTYLVRAKQKGWLYSNGSLKLVHIRKLFLDYYKGLEHFPGFEIVQSVMAEHGGMLGLLLRQYDWRRHPVKHLLLIAFLFDSTVEFDIAYAKVKQAYEEGGTDALEELVGEEWRNQLKQLVEFEHKSLSSAAMTIGIPLCVAIRVARQDGIAYKKRPRVFNTALGEKIREMIIEGLPREEILKSTGVNKSLLQELMAREPELREVWRKLDFEHSRDDYRENFIRLLDQHKGVSIKKLRMIRGNGVSWLYRNDREWFVKNLPCM